jgi:hypothetical protein
MLTSLNHLFDITSTSKAQLVSTSSGIVFIFFKLILLVSTFILISFDSQITFSSQSNTLAIIVFSQSINHVISFSYIHSLFVVVSNSSLELTVIITL